MISRILLRFVCEKCFIYLMEIIICGDNTMFCCCLPCISSALSPVFNMCVLHPVPKIILAIGWVLITKHNQPVFYSYPSQCIVHFCTYGITSLPDVTSCHDVTSGRDVMPYVQKCIKIDKPLVISIFSNVMLIFDINNNIVTLHNDKI